LKFSYRQILASAGGAVLSAVVASIFGVKGTIVGVAIGSVAATVGTALLFQSIERTRTAVKQVVVRAPDGTGLLNRLGGTNAAGVTQSETAGEPPSTSAGQTEDTAQAETSAPPVISSRQEVPEPDGASRIGLRWPVVAGVVVGVFIFALLFVTVVELIAGRPLADLFGHHGGGTTVEKIFENNPAPALPTTTTTSTTSTTTTSTTNSSSTTTTVAGSTTSSSGVGSTSTTTTGVPDTSTSTTATAG
jgi:hypothetical protein